MYTIKITYDTGNTFSSSTEERNVDESWESLDLAKEALRSIKEHKDKMSSLKESQYSYSKNQNPREVILSEMQVQGWYTENYEFEIKVRLDDGTYTSLYCFWMGYFENILRAEIVSPQSDMYVDF